MSKKLMILFIVFGLIFGGCSSTDSKQSGLPFIGSGSSTSASSDSGILIDFSDSNFEPQKDNEFSLVMNMKNYQVHAVDVRIRPTGFDWNYLKSGLEREFTVSMAAATQTGPALNAKYLEGIKLSDFTGDYNWNPVFKYCYNAATTFREQVCVPNKLNQCDATVEKSSYSNGPLNVKVDSVYPVGEDSLGIEFTVTNTNSGVVVNECFQDENKNEFGNKLTTEPIVKLGTEIGTCTSTSSSNGYMMNQNKLTFKCSFKRSGDVSDSYASQVTVDFDYNYAQKVKKQIVIRDLTDNYR